MNSLINCPRCGKAFIVPPENIYKVSINGTYQHLCSYTCYRAAKKELESKKKVKFKNYIKDL